MHFEKCVDKLNSYGYGHGLTNCHECQSYEKWPELWY